MVHTPHATGGQARDPELLSPVPEVFSLLYIHVPQALFTFLLSHSPPHWRVNPLSFPLSGPAVPGLNLGSVV